jgi:hypothetical protein
MNMKKLLGTLCILAGALGAQEIRAEDLFFTYLGVTAGGGASQVDYSEWVVDHRETKSATGTWLSGGAIIDIFVDRLIGEFTLQYMNSAMSADNLSVQHVYYSATGKYSWYKGNVIFATTGAGLYFGSGPSSSRYDGGGGGNAVLGMGLNAGTDWKITFDLNARYGHYGKGEETTGLSYGAYVAVLYRVGRL